MTISVIVLTPEETSATDTQACPALSSMGNRTLSTVNRSFDPHPTSLGRVPILYLRYSKDVTALSNTYFDQTHFDDLLSAIVKVKECMINN